MQSCVGCKMIAWCLLWLRYTTTIYWSYWSRTCTCVLARFGYQPCTLLSYYLSKTYSHCGGSTSAMFLCSWSYLGLYRKSLSTPIPWYVLEYQVEWPTIVIPLVRSFRVPPIIVIVVTFTCSVLFLEHGGYTLILWFVLVWVLKYSRSTKPSSSWCYYITASYDRYGFAMLSHRNTWFLRRHEIRCEQAWYE